MRAAEAGRYMVRAANRGITAVIDPHGRIVETLPAFEPGVLRHTVRGYTGATPYARVGNYLMIGLASAVIVMLFALARLRKPAATQASAR